MGLSPQRPIYLPRMDRPLHRQFDPFDARHGQGLLADLLADMNHHLRSQAKGPDCVSD